MTKAIKKGLFGPHIGGRYRHVCTAECSPSGGIHVIPQTPFEHQLQDLMEAMWTYYEDDGAICDEITVWARDWVAGREYEATP